MSTLALWVIIMLTMAFGLGDGVCELEAEDATLLALQGKARKQNPQNPWVEGQLEYWEVCGSSTHSPWSMFLGPSIIHTFRAAVTSAIATIWRS